MYFAGAKVITIFDQKLILSTRSKLDSVWRKWKFGDSCGILSWSSAVGTQCTKNLVTQNQLSLVKL